MGKRMTTLLTLLWPALLAGCNTAPDVTFYSTEKADNGLIVVLTGIEGASYFNDAIVDGLQAGGADCSIQRVDWTSHIPGAYVLNLRDQSANRQKARDLAMMVADYQKRHPKGPVYLVGQSGGGAMAAWIAEELPAGCKVEGIIMLAAALSPEYVLTDALRNSRRGIVNFYSERDIVLLGAGTTLAGTMDGEHTSSAGRVGFHLPGPECRPYYSRLYQVAWNPQMESGGNYGLHLTSGSARFVAGYIAPLIRARQWDERFIWYLAAGNPKAEN